MGDVTYREGERVEAHGFGWGWDRPVGGTIEAPRGMMAPGCHRVLLDTGESVVRARDEIRPTAKTIAALRALVVAYADEPSLSLASEEAWGRCVERYDARSQPVYTADPTTLRRLYDAIAEAGQLPSRLKVAMQAVERARWPRRVSAYDGCACGKGPSVGHVETPRCGPTGAGEIERGPARAVHHATRVRVECGGEPVLLDGEPIFVDLGIAPSDRAEMGRELRKLIADARQGPDAFVADLSTGKVTPVPAPWQVGDPCEVQRGSGRWWPGIVVAITPDVDGEPVVHARYERDGIAREAAERCDSGGLRRPVAYEHEDPPSAPEAPPPADAPAFPATCLLCGAPAYHGAISAECSRGARCGDVPMPRVERFQIAPADEEHAEFGWRAHGSAGGAYASVEHPTRDGAIAAWRELVRRLARSA